MPDLIAALARSGTDVFVTPGPRAAEIVREVAPEMPVVAVALPASYPALFQSLARPGGRVTGFSHIGTGLAAKRIELLGEALPGLQSVAILCRMDDPLSSDWAAETARAARGRGLEANLLGLASLSAAQLPPLLASARAAGAQGLIVIRDYGTESLRAEIFRYAAEVRLASLAEHRNFAEAGALLSYGASLPDLFRRAAEYVDRMLNGTDPGELPIQLPTRFELVLNLGTARTLELTLPPSLLARADEVIE